MSMCNHCMLKRIKSRAEANGKEVLVIAGDVYVFPVGTENPTIPRSPDDGNKFWVAWMMSISEKCAC